MITSIIESTWWYWHSSSKKIY